MVRAILARIVILCQLPRWRFAKDKRAGVAIDWLRVGVQVQVAMDRLLLALGVAVVLLYVALDLLHMHLLSAAAGGGAGKTTQHAHHVEELATLEEFATLEEVPRMPLEEASASSDACLANKIPAARPQDEGLNLPPRAPVDACRGA